MLCYQCTPSVYERMTESINLKQAHKLSLYCAVQHGEQNAGICYMFFNNITLCVCWIQVSSF